MTDVGQIERNTQNRVVKLFRDQLEYDYLGYWQDREGNSNVEEPHLRPFLEKQGYTPNIIDRALHELTKRAGVQTKELYTDKKNSYHAKPTAFIFNYCELEMIFRI